MANTQKYLNHLLQNTGITPACSEEERQAADIIAEIFSNHGFEPEVQEFNAKGTAKVVQAVLGIVVFAGAFLAGVGGVAGVVGMVMLVLAVIVYLFERNNKPVFSQLGAGGLSQNVIAYHKASGPLASPRNRPVVVVAHYDSPRVDFLSQEPFSAYRPLIVKSLPYLMVAPVVILIVRLFPVPTGAKVVLWLLAVVAALVPLAYSISIIANRFVLPYTTGSVCNKSSVAALLGVMDEVSPYRGHNEFPDDVPFDEYFAEQQRMAEEAALVAEAERLEREQQQKVKRESLKGKFGFGKGAQSEEGGEAEDASEFEEIEGELPEDDSPFKIEDFDVEGGADDFDGTISATLVTDALEEGLEATAVGGALDEEEPFDEGSTIQIDSEEVDEALAAPLEDEEGAEPASEDATEGEAPEDESTVADVPAVEYPLINSEGYMRHGAEVVRSLGMLPARVTLLYPEDLVVAEKPQEVSEKEAREAAAKKRVEERRKQAEEERAAREAQRASIRKAVAEEYEERMLQGQEDARRLSGEDDEGFELDQDAAKAPASDAVSEVPESNAEDEAAAQDASGNKTAQFFVVGSEEDAAPTAPRRNIETVDSLMAEITGNRSGAQRVPQRSLNIPSTSTAKGDGAGQRGNRSALFDVPDPSAEAVDPFTIPSSLDEPEEEEVVPEELPQAQEEIPTISAPKQEKERHGLARLFGRKKEGAPAQSEADSEDEFYDSDSSWKGGATGSEDMSEEELREAITSMGDDELLGHDIWFVATGASENGNAGIEAFLNTHRDKLRGVFLINLECVGAGQVSMLSTEGARRVLKGDKRIMKLVSRVSADFHDEYPAVEMSHIATDAYAAMSRSLRSLTIAGVEGTGFALSHTEDDQPYNVDPDKVAMVAEVVTEVIRRS